MKVKFRINPKFRAGSQSKDNIFVFHFPVL